MTTKDTVYNERCKKMLAYQENVKPVPTMRDLGELWGLSSTSAVDYALKKLAERGQVKMLQKGKYHQYVAVEAKNE